MTIVDSFFNTLFVHPQILRISLFLLKYIFMSIWKRKFMPKKGQTESIRNEMSLLGMRRSVIGQFIFLFLLIVPEVFAKVISAQFTSLF